MKVEKTPQKKHQSKKEKKASKFPSISRFIPEKINEGYIFLAIFLFIFVCTVIIGLDLYQNLSLEKKLAFRNNELQRRLDFWKKEVKIHPNYRDAYFNLALISYQLKDFDSSIYNLQKALEIDPNFEKGRQFQEILSGSF